MPDANDIYGPFDGSDGEAGRWTQTQWYRDAPTWAPTAVIGNPPTGSTTGGLALTTSGLTASVGLGRAHVRGAGYERVNTPKAITVPANTHASFARRDRIAIRRDIAAKTVEPILIQGTPAGTPAAPTLTRTDGTIWDCPLFSFLVPASSGSTISGVIDERVWWDPNGTGPVVVPSQDARSAQISYEGFEVYRSDLRMHETFVNGTWRRRGSAQATKSRFMLNSASGPLGAGVSADLAPRQTVAGAPFGSGVNWQLTLDARVHLSSIPAGLGARLELLIDGVVFGGDEFTNAGSTPCRATLRARDIAYVNDNSSREVYARVTALAGTITVSTFWGRVFIEAAPYEAL